MRMWLGAAIVLLSGDAVAAVSPYEAAVAGSAHFDLADFTAPAPLVTSETRADRRFLAPEIEAPPGLAKKPAKLRIRGRKVKLRIPLG